MGRPGGTVGVAGTIARTLQYRLTDHVNAYAQYSTGFKGGGVNPRPFAVQQVQPFGPETLTTWEAGLKSDLFEQHVQLECGGVHFEVPGHSTAAQRLSAIQSAGHPADRGVSVRVACERGHGGHRRASRWRRIFGPCRICWWIWRLSYVDFEYTSIAPQAGGPTNPGGVQKGMISPYTPEWKASLGAQYTFDIGARSDRSFRGWMRAYQSKVWGTAINSDRTRIDGYTIANARLTWMNAAKRSGGRARGHQCSGRVLLPDDVRGVCRRRSLRMRSRAGRGVGLLR